MAAKPKAKPADSQKTVTARALRAFVMPEFPRPVAADQELTLTEERALSLMEAGLVDILDEPADAAE